MYIEPPDTGSQRIAMSDQSLTTIFGNQRENRILLISRIIGKVHPRIKLFEHAAGEHRETQMW